MYPGNLKVLVDALITVLTKLLIYATLGFAIFNLSQAILFKAVLSKTIYCLFLKFTTASAFNANLFNVNNELYG